jgi:predicted nucleic acid-binding protein
MIAVDSSVWIDYLRDRPTPQVELLDGYLADHASDVALVDVVLTEVLCGLREEHVQRVEPMLLDLAVLQMQWLPDFRAAAGLYRAARKTGVTIRSTVDCMIAAVCIREHVSLLHSDADFDRLSEISELTTIRVG